MFSAAPFVFLCSDYGLRHRFHSLSKRLTSHPIAGRLISFDGIDVFWRMRV
jgi:glucose-6-phosphate-specific signal transduction histidine kinase